jgi:hypothetical protein
MPAIICGRQVDRRLGYSLVELAMTLPAIAVLTLGMSAAVLVSVRSIPQPGSLITANTEATRVLERLERDLRCATEILVRNPSEVQFRVPDRDNDGQPETIRYSWSGVAGDAVLRQFNSNPVETIFSQTANFRLEYGIESVTREVVQRNVETSPEVLLSSGPNWGVTPSIDVIMNINRNSWAACIFNLSPQIPLDLSRLRITRVEFLSRRNSVGVIRVGIYRVAVGLLPRLTFPVGTPVAFSTTSMPPMAWLSTSVALGSDTWIDDGCRRFVLLISSTAANTPLQLRCKYSDSAPASDLSTLRFTSNQGVSWQPDQSVWNRADLYYGIYGQYERTVVSQAIETIQQVRSIRVVLNSATNQSVRIDASIGLLNQPRAN